MTSAKNMETDAPFRLPEIPERHPDEMTAYKHVYDRGIPESLRQHFGRADVLITADHWICERPGEKPICYPDLLIAFGVSPELHVAQNGYVISEQGKPPDFILEVASPSTGRRDIEEKLWIYQQLQVAEYWRFDSTGGSHGTKLAAERMADGTYRSIPILEGAGGSLWGHSQALNLTLVWEGGHLLWIDQATGKHIRTHQEERDRADHERDRADHERDRRLAAEARVRELEEKLKDSDMPDP